MLGHRSRGDLASTSGYLLALAASTPRGLSFLNQRRGTERHPLLGGTPLRAEHHAVRCSPPPPWASGSQTPPSLQLGPLGSCVTFV